MSTLMQANAQWSSRPADERFTSLVDLRDHAKLQREASRGIIATTRNVEAFAPDRLDPDSPLLVNIAGGSLNGATTPTNWSFGQLANLAGAPAKYLRSLPASLAADCINAGMLQRDVEEVGALLRMDQYSAGQAVTLAAATGPNYGRIWYAEIAETLVRMFGDGVTGDWRVPGEFGKRVTVDKNNTTLYLGDRNMFVFLADEDHRIEVPNRRNGEAGSLARGFFIWNSEVGDCTLGIGMFLFDYVCCNRIIWGSQNYRELKIRHTKGAPHRFLEQVKPALVQMSQASAQPVVDMIAAAQAARKDDMRAWLAKRYNPGKAAKLDERHIAEEGRPIESLWDVSTALTAMARDIQHQDARVAEEREAGEVLKLAA